MERAQARGLSRSRIARLLSVASDELSIGARISLLSNELLGYPYSPNPLIGSAETAEVFTASLDGFDCVTFIETVLALARSFDIDGFVAALRRVRYDGGCVRWERRNHYMTSWIRNNAREGIVRPIATRDLPMVVRERVLNVVSGLAAQRIRIRCAPKSAMPRLMRRLKTGDLIFFASTRANLDVFHAGIIVRDGATVSLRHASRGQGRAVEQDLRGFLKANRMAGVIVARPREIQRRR